MWKGKVFHLIVAEFLKRIYQGHKVSLTEILTQHINQMENQWNFSMKIIEVGKLSKHLYNPQQNDFILLEHLYQKDFSKNSLNGAIQDVKNWIERFVIWNEEESIEEAILKSSKVWIEPPTYGQEIIGFEIDGIRVVTKVDLAFLNPEKQFIIFDWKTSVHISQFTYWAAQPEFQAAVYQLWPNLKFNKSLDRISAHFLYFGNEPYKKQSFQLDKNMKEYTLSLIRRSISRMRYFHQIHHDKFQLILDGMLRLTLDDLDFAYMENSCVYCPFKRICQRELEI
jgi:hypothetical protein